MPLPTSIPVIKKHLLLLVHALGAIVLYQYKLYTLKWQQALSNLVDRNRNKGIVVSLVVEMRFDE